MEVTPSPPLVPRPSPRRDLVERVRRWVGWFGLARLVAAGASVVLVAVAAWWLLRAPRPSTESQLPYAGAASTTSMAQLPAPTTASPSAASTSAVDLVVHVAGAVVAPGVYHLGPTSRVVDAVSAAGGLTPSASVDAVNLAAPLRDGSRVYVPAVGEAVPAAVGVSGGVDPAATSLPAGPLDVNTATPDELDTLPGVGPSTAAAIVAYRDAHGPFGTIDDLGEVRGIGPAKLDAIRGLVTT